MWAWLNWPSPARWALTAAFWCIANFLLFLPSQSFRDIGQVFPFQDKIVHLAIFGILAALIRWSIPSPWGRGWKGVVVVLVLILYGIGTECLQALFPSLGRSFEWADILVNFIGVVAGTVLCGRVASATSL
jgi:VanZ family protein